MKYVFAGDRDIAVHVLQYLIGEGYSPQALLVVEEGKATHAKDLVTLSGLSEEMIFAGCDFKRDETIQLLNSLEPDYIIGIHFPYIIPSSVLQIPKVGFLNLHPAYLPYNRGWHTPTWAILDETPVGATLHFMAEKLDAGDIINQKQMQVLPHDTADCLYKRLKELELEVFKESLPELLSLSPHRQKQELLRGTSHNKKDLYRPEVQEIRLDKEYNAKALIDRVRALTTNSLDEAAYFVDGDKKYRIRVQIFEE
jgi:methionyl-tRNA formyltransferase